MLNLQKSPMSVNKSLKQVFVLKSVAIPECYLRGNVEFPGEP
jgi:hypothetical protein